MIENQIIRYLYKEMIDSHVGKWAESRIPEHASRQSANTLTLTLNPYPNPYTLYPTSYIPTINQH